MIRVFISSVQKELAEERRAVKDVALGDPLFRRFIGDVFPFEDTPALIRNDSETTRPEERGRPTRW
jgi:ATP-dependent DNA helicase RecG